MLEFRSIFLRQCLEVAGNGYARSSAWLLGSRCRAKFLTSHHVCMHRLIFFMANTLMKLII